MRFLFGSGIHRFRSEDLQPDAAGSRKFEDCEDLSGVEDLQRNCECLKLNCEGLPLNSEGWSDRFASSRCADGSH